MFSIVTIDTVDQLQEQLQRERSQHAFDNAYHQEQITLLLQEIAELRYDIARRDREKAFAEAPSPSAMMH
jgi:hypothetical protein